jgi:hypothetical protein
MSTELRHYCRNQRCRSKLAAPVGNEHQAFCCGSCFEQFYRTRCLVCETRKHHQRRQLCGHVRCKAEKARFPHLYTWSPAVCWGTLAETPQQGSEVPVKRALKWLPGSLRAFAWEETGPDTWTLHHRVGTTRALVVRRAADGDRWWVARPHAFPEPPVEPLADAQRRAVTMALWTLPPLKAPARQAAEAQPC